MIHGTVIVCNDKSRAAGAWHGLVSIGYPRSVTPEQAASVCVAPQIDCASPRLSADWPMAADAVQGRLNSVYGDDSDLPSVVHMDPVHKGTAMATAHSIHAVASRDTSNEYLLGGRMGSGNVGLAVSGMYGANFTPPAGPYAHRGPALPSPPVLSPTTPTFWPGAPAGGGHSGRRSLSRTSTGSGRAAQCELAVSTAGASTVSPCPSASMAPARGGPAANGRGEFMQAEADAAPAVAGRRRSGALGVSGSGTRGHTFVETCSIGTPRQPPGPHESLQVKMDFIHFQLDSFGGSREILYGIILLGAGTLYRFQGGAASSAHVCVCVCVCMLGGVATAVARSGDSV